MPIIGEQSPLRRLPSRLDGEQLMYLSGIRYAVEMLDLAYERLKISLLWLTETEPPYDAPTFTSAFQDAWTMVDSGNRLRVLADRMPQVKKKAPQHQLLIRGLKPLEDLRHAVQHLDTELQKWKEHPDDLAVWGSLGWVAKPTSVAENHMMACVAVAGAVRRQKGTPIPNPAGRLMTLPVDLVQLTAFGTSVELSDVWTTVETWVGDLESVLTPAFDEEKTLASDMVVKITIDSSNDGTGW